MASSLRVRSGDRTRTSALLRGIVANAYLSAILTFVLVRNWVILVLFFGLLVIALIAAMLDHVGYRYWGQLTFLAIGSWLAFAGAAGVFLSASWGTLGLSLILLLGGLIAVNLTVLRWRVEPVQPRSAELLARRKEGIRDVSMFGVAIAPVGLLFLLLTAMPGSNVAIAVAFAAYAIASPFILLYLLHRAKRPREPFSQP